MKEFLAETGIPAAKCKLPRVKRKLKKLPAGEISQPQHGTVKFQKTVLHNELEEGEDTQISTEIVQQKQP